MKALRWHGKHDVRVEEVPDPRIQEPGDMIVDVTSSAICGSDLHLYDGYIPAMKKGDILGHEFMGEVAETGSAVRRFKKGDRVAVPFNISCGSCYFCAQGSYSLCDNSNPDASMAAAMYGHSAAGLFGYSHLFGGYPGGQAEYVRVPFADVIPIKIPSGIADDEVLFLTDIFPTGYMAAENCHIHPGDTVAVWGAGPVGQFAAKSALLLGAGRVIVIDRFDYRLKRAEAEGVVTVNYGERHDVIEDIKQMTGGRGPDSCIDAVGMEAHGHSFMGVYDNIKQTLRLESDRPTVLRWAVQVCRKGGTVSIPGVYGGFVDKFPLGAAFNKGLSFRMGQTSVHRYMEPLLRLIETGKIKPSFVISHRITLEEAPEYYRIFRDKKEECLKVVIGF